MKKKQVLWILLDLVFLAVFNVIFFLVGGKEHSTAVWICYAAIHVAYLLLVITPMLTAKSKNPAVLGFPLYTVSGVYFLVVFVVSLVFILINPENYKTCLVIQIILMGLYLVLLFANLIANESTAEAEARHEQELRYVKEGSEQIKGIMECVSDRKMRRKVEEIYDLLHASPVKSSAEVREYELKVLDDISTLDACFANNDTEGAEAALARIKTNAETRNRKLKLLN